MDIQKNFKEMPLFLKILFIISAYSFIMSIVSLLRMEPIAVSYFGTGFPKDYPFIWYLFNVIVGGFGIYVYLNRSYSLLYKYVVFGIIMVIISLLNVFTSIGNELKSEQIIAYVLIYGIVILITVLIMSYLLRQKKYFNKV